jgi:NTE family protein
MASVPPGVTVHLLPTGDPEQPKFNELTALRYRDASMVTTRIQLAHEAATAYLMRLQTAG